MFADPQTITVNGVAKTLARVESKGLSSTYQTADELWKLFLSHQVMQNGRVKTMTRFDQRLLVTNPIDQSVDYDTFSDWFVMDRPLYGFDLTTIQYQVTGHKSWLDNTAIAKLFGKES